MNGIQHPLFVSAPQRRQQVPFGAVAGEAVNDHFPGNAADAVLQQADVPLQVR